MSSHEDITRDLAVVQLLTRLVRETDRIVRLADDIDNYANTPEAKEAFATIGTEVENILIVMGSTISPLYNLYETDDGLKALAKPAKQKHKPIKSHKIITAEIVSRQEK